MTYPKVLIIGQYFNKNSGGGITLTNLFYGWDKKGIAVAAFQINKPDFSVCENYYNIGDIEIVREFPFNLKMKRDGFKSGVLLYKSNQEENLLRIDPQNGKSLNIKDKFLLLTGQIHRRRRFHLSAEFLKWVSDFSPDIIYSQLSSLELIRFISILKSQLHKPLVLHIMDDWPSTITYLQKGLFKHYWTNVINRELISLFSKANALMSISEYMSEEYLKRYGLIFIPFHNPIDVNHWIVTNKIYEKNGSFIILYAGRIGAGLKDSLVDVAIAINILIASGLDIEFHIQATRHDPLLNKLKMYKFITIKKPVPYDNLPQIFAKSDLLLLPNDFDEQSISFLKYSMPTKASEYMISGTPILVYSSLDSAITKHALKYNWAYVVSENSTEELVKAIATLYNDKNLRATLGKTAKEFANKNFNSFTIRENFKNLLDNCKEPLLNNDKL